MILAITGDIVNAIEINFEYSAILSIFTTLKPIPYVPACT